MHSAFVKNECVLIITLHLFVLRTNMAQRLLPRLTRSWQTLTKSQLPAARMDRTAATLPAEVRDRSYPKLGEYNLA